MRGKYASTFQCVFGERWLFTNFMKKQSLLFSSHCTPHSPSALFLFSLLCLFLLSSCCQVKWLMRSKDVAKYMVILWSVDIAPKKNRNAVCLLLWPTFHTFPQNASTLHLALSQPICVAAVMCRSAHWRPFLPLVPSGNNCRSEHIHIMLLSDLVVTTEQHQGTFMGLMLAKSFILNSCHLSLSWV